MPKLSRNPVVLLSAAAVTIVIAAAILASGVGRSSSDLLTVPPAATVPAAMGAVADSQPPLFDPTRDPAADLEAAVAVATRTGRRIILDVGGNWCSWCLILDHYIRDDPALDRFVADHYVWVRVNFSPGNPNEAFLSQYPSIDGYPHLFVLEADGTLLHSQSTAELEQGRSYSADRMWAFLRSWAAPGSAGRDSPGSSTGTQ